MARPDQPPDSPQADLKQADPGYAARRRGGVRRTALVLGVIAAVIYAAFILSGVLGGAPG